MELITDRTEADVLLGNEKGKYHYSDLNRVETAVKELLELVKPLDFYPQLVTKTDWGDPGVFAVDRWPTNEQLQRYLKNVNTLCDFVLVETDSIPHSPDFWDWKDANAIEKALQDVYLRVMGAINSFRYSGELYAGDYL